MRGAAVCRKHGGKAPQVLAAAARRLDDLRPLAIRRLEWLMEQEAYPTTMLGASRDVLDRVDGRPTERSAVTHDGTLTIRWQS